jgi:hypothetical protein
MNKAGKGPDLFALAQGSIRRNDICRKTARLVSRDLIFLVLHFGQVRYGQPCRMGSAHRCHMTIASGIGRM